MNEQVNEINNNSSDNPILDIVNSIQSKLNENNSSNINNNISNTINNNFNNSNKKDLSGLDISKILENFTSASTKNNFSAPNLGSNNSGLNLDMNTIMNISKVLNGVNQSDPRRDLLTSLKPFLRETRQKNIDTYITLLGVMKAFNIFTNKDRD